MRAILPFLASLMLMLTAWTVAAHAAERPMAAAGTTLTAHDHGGAGDEDHAPVHQHGGCHGHFLDIARAPSCSPGPVAAGGIVAAWNGAPRVSAMPPPNLRPPQA